MNRPAEHALAFRIIARPSSTHDFAAAEDAGGGTLYLVGLDGQLVTVTAPPDLIREHLDAADDVTDLTLIVTGRVITRGDSVVALLADTITTVDDDAAVTTVDDAWSGSGLS